MLYMIIIMMRVHTFGFIVEPSRDDRFGQQIFADCIKLQTGNNSTLGIQTQPKKKHSKWTGSARKKTPCKKERALLAKMHGNNAEKITADYVVSQFNMECSQDFVKLCTNAKKFICDTDEMSSK